MNPMYIKFSLIAVCFLISFAVLLHRNNGVPFTIFCSPISRLSNITFYEGIKVTERGQIGSYLEKINFKVGAEVGVQRGYFSKNILDQWKSATKFYLIDVWSQQKSNYKDSANVDDNAQLSYFAEAKGILKPYENKTVFLRMTSSEGAKHIPDNSLDFVYLDARHDYCGVREDLTTFWPKVKHGGVIAGHDYIYALVGGGNDWGVCADGSYSPLGVKGAVNEFSVSHCAYLHQLSDGPWASWMLFK